MKSIENSTAEQKHAEKEIQKVTGDYKKIKDILEEVMLFLYLLNKNVTFLLRFRYTRKHRRQT